MRSRARGSLVVVTALAAVLTGCGDGDDGEGNGDGGGDFAEQSAAEITEAAKDAMRDLEAVTVDGSLSAGDQEIDIAMSVGEGGDCTGSFGTQGATAEILGVDGTTWFRPDPAFWELIVGPEAAPQIIESAGDRWVTLPDDDTSFKPFCDLEELLGELVDEDGDADYTKGEREEIDGEETIEIISERPEEGISSGYVRVAGEHYLVRIVKEEGDDPGEVTFSGFDEQPDVEAPADDEQVALEDVESGAY